MATTIQHLLAQARLVNQFIAVFTGSGPLTPAQKVLLAEVTSTALVLSSGLSDYALTVGAGLYPNTFVRSGSYMFVNTPNEESAARKAGWVPATFPQTMIKFGGPDQTVHNAVQKSAALSAGYTLPGLPASSASADELG